MLNHWSKSVTVTTTGRNSEVQAFPGSQDLCPRWAPVVHACNPNYSGSRDQEDQGSKPAQANSSVRPRPYLETPFTKTGLVEWLKVKALGSNTSTTKTKQQQKILSVYVTL
jgi:hypothetical protein